MLSACATTPAGDPARVQREIEAQYAKLADAFQREDLAGILSFRTPDMYAVGPDGRRMDYAQMADYARGWLELNKQPIRVKSTIREVVMNGPDEAAVTVYQQGSRRQDLAGAERTMEHSVTQRETWVRTPNGWRIQRVDSVTGQRKWVDGKEIDPKKPFDPAAPPFTPEPPPPI
jgi:ketosteroid isomerase-like protein